MGDTSRFYAIYDPVPEESAVGVCGDCERKSHQLETQVQRWLLTNPRLNFASLVVRGIPNGLCLEGVLRGDDAEAELEAILRQLPGVKRVVNNIRICPSGEDCSV
ncbi:MAG: BON domain-containing protein [Planctomycetaceae bacterium]|nr:BON domain-containing protein [Planctomycetaceae bacterium]